MGKRKIDVSGLIKSDARRAVTYSKRKRGLIKKAIELSNLCGQDIYIAIFDKAK